MLIYRVTNLNKKTNTHMKSTSVRSRNTTIMTMILMVVLKRRILCYWSHTKSMIEFLSRKEAARKTVTRNKWVHKNSSVALSSTRTSLLFCVNYLNKNIPNPVHKLIKTTESFLPNYPTLQHRNTNSSCSISCKDRNRRTKYCSSAWTTNKTLSHRWSTFRRSWP